MSWKDSEKEAKIFLDKNISEWGKNNQEFKKICFIPEGGEDSTAPDIKVTKNNKNIFNIEVKKNKSQIGQFVIDPDLKNKVFNLSDKNKGDKKRTIEINNYMNKHFDDYKKPTTKGLTIKCSQKTTYKCVEKYLEDKNYKYIAYKINNNFKIIHYKQFSNFLSAKPVYRKKKSGSRPVGAKANQVKLKKYLKEKFKLNEDDFLIEKKFYLKFSAINQKDWGKFDPRRYLMNKKYYISPSKKNIVELRILSTKSGGPTVLFAISMKDENKKDNIDLFKKDLLNND